jgi:hypothetical protein
VVYQVTKATTRLLGRDSSSRRRHMLATVQARPLGVHFYLEARAWPTEFIFKHKKKIAIFADAGCPPGTLSQRNGKPYLREHFVFWLPEGGIGIATVDQPGPGAFVRLRLFLRQFLPVLRSVQEEIGAGDGNRIVSPIHKSCDLTALPPPPVSNGAKWSQIRTFAWERTRLPAARPSVLPIQSAETAVRAGPAALCVRCSSVRSKRSRFITLVQAATKSATNFSCASAEP